MHTLARLFEGIGNWLKSETFLALPNSVVVSQLAALNFEDEHAFRLMKYYEVCFPFTQVAVTIWS
jgi:hypothetical protein